VKKFVLSVTLIMCSALLFGCEKRDEALDGYHASMDAFSSNATQIHQEIEDIDADSDDASEQLLTKLDELDSLYKDMAELEVPEEFQAIESLADEASENMTQSVSLYHMAFDGYEEYDSVVTDAALEYYQRAQKRIDYIGTLLKGEMPEGEGITYEREGDDAGSEFDDMDKAEDSDESDSSEDSVNSDAEESEEESSEE